MFAFTLLLSPFSIFLRLKLFQSINTRTQLLTFNVPPVIVVIIGGQSTKIFTKQAITSKLKQNKPLERFQVKPITLNYDVLI